MTSLSPTSWQKKSHSLWEAGDRQGAIDSVIAAINQGQAQGKLLCEPCLRLCYYLLQLGDFAASEQVLEQLLVHYPTNSTVLENRGVVKLRLGQAAAAVADFRAVIAQNPTSINAWDGLTHALYLHQSWGEATEAGIQALTLKAQQYAVPDREIAWPTDSPQDWDASHPGQDVIAFSLWGTNPRYLRGAVCNLLAAATIYPSWQCRFYVDETVPAEFCAGVREQGGQIILQPTQQSLRQKLSWRFQVANDPTVRRFLVRDADSVVSAREAHAVAEWLASDRWFHVMRDHWTHTDLILAGMWGGRARLLPEISSMVASYQSGRMETANIDQWFLRDLVWPLIQRETLIHDRYFRVLNALPWPDPSPADNFHVGQNEFAARPSAQVKQLGDLIDRYEWLQIPDTKPKQKLVVAESQSIAEQIDLGSQMYQAGDFPAAAAIFQQVLQQRPNNPDAWHFLGLIASQQKQYMIAIERIKQAIAVMPNQAILYSNLGNILRLSNNLDQADIACRKAIQLDPEYPNGHYNFSLLLLQTGSYRQGWIEYEWRFKTNKPPEKAVSTAMWQQQLPTDRTVLLWSEQGLGDSIQFIRYVPLLQQQGVSVVIATQPPLVKLFQECLTNSSAVVINQNTTDLSSYEVHLSLMSLPKVLGTTLETIPSNIPYLHPPSNLPPKLRLAETKTLKIGLVWASSSINAELYQQKSFAANLFFELHQHLLTAQKISVWSMQVGVDASQIEPWLSLPGVFDLSTLLTDFTDTASVIAQLDLVITVDTAVAHLAGAMGKPTWVLLPFSSDWRWLLERQDSPWYPTIRLFRQSTPDNWSQPLGQIEQELQGVLAGQPMLPPVQIITTSLFAEDVAIAQGKQLLQAGIRHYQAGELPAAAAQFQQIIQHHPHHADAWHFLGLVAAQQKQYSTAITNIERAIEIAPDRAVFHSNLGNILRWNKDLERANTSLQKAIQLNPKLADAYYNLGTLYQEQGQIPAAIAAYQKLLSIDPKHIVGSQLGYMLHKQGRISEAVAAYQQALAVRPHYGLYNNLGLMLQEQGKTSEAIAAYQQAISMKSGHSGIHSNILLCLHYDGKFDPETIYREHRQWNEKYAAPLATTFFRQSCRPIQDRLRIGYISGDFKTHSVAYFVEPLLTAHDRQKFEIICYANNERTDDVTERLKALVSDWRDISKLPDEQVTELIYQDRIDILVDLCGHTANNRLLVFARKPAPIQVSYLGYPDTTGLDAMDYRLTDAWADPVGKTESLHSEQLVRLPDGFLCYQPPAEAPIVSPPPAISTGYITFASFNTLAKISPQLVGYWANILTAVPHSRLLLKAKALAGGDTRAYIQELFRQHGIDADRLELYGWTASSQEHLALYQRVDIALDTFPYHGTTTTCEAMWMGVPVITLAGPTHVSRVGVSLLATVGLPELIADSPESYINKAIDLAQDLDRLTKLRAEMRDRFQQAPISNATLITRSLEDAYRQMWNSWCASSTFTASGQIDTQDGDRQVQQQFDLGVKYYEAEDLTAADRCFQQVLAWQPEHVDALHMSGIVAAKQDRYPVAIERIQKAIAIDPTQATFYNSLGNTLKFRGNLTEALAAYQQAIQRDPHYANAYYNLGNAYKAQYKLTEAISAYQQAIQLNPNHENVYKNLGNALKDRGQITEAIASYQQAVRTNPKDSRVHSNLLLCLHYSHDHAPAAIYREHQQWAKVHALPLTSLQEQHPHRQELHAPIRVGYISGDLKDHSIAYFLEPVFANHNHREFKITCYNNHKQPDATTERLKDLADEWREVATLPDEQVAALIRQDKIDILVDLSGHTAANRLLVLARKPAPVQVSYLGYPDTTGLDAIDYRLTDIWADPVGQTELLHSEELFRLPHGFLCYQPPALSGAVSWPPVLSTEQITFGCFNNFVKVNPQLVGYWAAILQSVPHSRLLLKAHSLADTETRAYLLDLFQQHEIAADRIEAIGWLQDKQQHLALYHRVDIALDTFPYHGTTTTCEALWMGVPVITLAGATHVARVGVSLLSSVGLTELIAESPEDYIQKAIDLAQNLDRLTGLRAGMRDRLTQARLTNAVLITHSLEDAYRQMWHRWCHSNQDSISTINHTADRELPK